MYIMSLILSESLMLLMLYVKSVSIVTFAPKITDQYKLTWIYMLSWIYMDINGRMVHFCIGLEGQSSVSKL